MTDDLADGELVAVLSSSTVGAALRDIAGLLARRLASPSIGIYVWSHGSGSFELVNVTAAGEALPRRLPIDVPFDLDAELPVRPADLDAGLEMRPVRDNRGVVGAVVHEVGARWTGSATLLAAALVRPLSIGFYEEMLTALQQPLEFRASRDEFFSALAVVASLAADMELVVIREHDGADLRCIAFEGFDGVEATDLDLVVGEHPMFDRVLDGGRAVTLRSLSEAQPSVVGDLASRPGLAGVESFVVLPLMSGEVVTGTLSLASRYQVTFSSDRIGAFQALARSIGVSIANFHNFHSTLGDLSDLSRVAVSITALEVAQSARHEAKALIGNILAQLTILQQHINQRDNRAAFKDIDSLKGHANRINVSIDKIKSATDPPRQLLQSMELEEVWNEARDQVISRLNDLKIRTTYSGPSQVVEGYREWLRHVFLNLLLNSMDAFDSRGRKGDRRIRLRVREEASTESMIVLRYEDTAGGIRVEEFAGIENPDGLPVERLIFEPGATTKPDGSGWGMFLVREILQRHGGSIDAVALRSAGGVVFDIRLPVSQDVDR